MSTEISHAFRVLVVEDQEFFRNALVEELTFYGFQSSTALDGEEGLKAAISSNFDVILSDMRMPNRDGKWLLNELRKTKRCAPPFIFMTGFTDLALQDALAMGADGFLGKPLDTDRLNAVLTKVCKPIESRWNTRPKDEPVHTFTNQFTSMDSANGQLRILLGRGGMFLAVDKTSLRVGDVVEFKFTFSEGAFSLLEGMGRIIWKRDTSADTSAPGYGIDFEYLSSDSLPGWLDYLRKQDILAFIPQG